MRNIPFAPTALLASFASFASFAPIVPLVPLLSSCLELPTIPDDTPVACNEADGCPPGRRCSSGGTCVDDENVPPAVPSDLDVVAGPDDASLVLRFTAPGDDGTDGDPAARYEVVLAEKPGTEAVRRSIDRLPATPGSFEALVVDGLPPATAFSVQLEVFDDADNSARSAVVEAATAGPIGCLSDAATCLTTQVCGIEAFCVDADGVAPGRVVDVHPVLSETTLTSITVRFTAPGDDGFDPAGAAARLVVHVRPHGVDDGVGQAVAITPPSGLQLAEATVGELLRGTVYDVFVEAIDDAGNASVGGVATIETGGVACRVPDADGTFAIRGDFVATRDEQLIRLMGCEVIDGGLDVDARNCGIGSIAPLASLREVTGALLVGSNPLCATSPVSVDGLARLEVAGSVIVSQLDLVDATLPALQTANYVGFVVMPSLARISVPALASADTVEFVDLPALDTIEAPALGPVSKFRIERAAVATLTTPALFVDEFVVADAPALVAVVGSEALTVEIADAPRLTRLALPALVQSTVRNVGVEALSVGPSARVVVASCPALHTLAVDAEDVTVEDNDALASLALTLPVAAGTVRGNASLAAASIRCLQDPEAAGAPDVDVVCALPPGFVVCGNGDDAPCP